MMQPQDEYDESRLPCEDVTIYCDTDQQLQCTFEYSLSSALVNSIFNSTERNLFFSRSVNISQLSTEMLKNKPKTDGNNEQVKK